MQCLLFYFLLKKRKKKLQKKKNNNKKNPQKTTLLFKMDNLQHASHGLQATSSSKSRLINYSIYLFFLFTKYKFFCFHPQKSVFVVKVKKKNKNKF